MKSATFSRAFCILSATAISTSSASFSFFAMIPARRSSSDFVWLNASCASVKLTVADFNWASSESRFFCASANKLLFSASQSVRMSAFVLSWSSALAEIAERIISSSKLSPSTYFQTMFKNSFSNSLAVELEQWHAVSILNIISSTGIALRKSLKVLYSARVKPLVLYVAHEIEAETIFFTISSGLFNW